MVSKSNVVSEATSTLDKGEDRTTRRQLRTLRFAHSGITQMRSSSLQEQAQTPAVE